jgi:hypothetical protein
LFELAFPGIPPAMDTVKLTPVTEMRPTVKLPSGKLYWTNGYIVEPLPMAAQRPQAPMLKSG